MNMEIIKSTRHRKIIGNLGEHLICNWLSRSGFEVTIVDHTGIDIIAYNSSSRMNQRLGITVKSRTRNRGTEKDSVYLFSHKKEKNDLEKLLNACKAFACEPWIAIYIETSESADIYLTSLKNYQNKYRSQKANSIDDWKITKKYQEQYEKDKDVKHIKIKFQPENWNW